MVVVVVSGAVCLVLLVSMDGCGLTCCLIVEGKSKGLKDGFIHATQAIAAQIWVYRMGHETRQRSQPLAIKSLFRQIRSYVEVKYADLQVPIEVMVDWAPSIVESLLVELPKGSLRIRRVELWSSSETRSQTHFNLAVHRK